MSIPWDDPTSEPIRDIQTWVLYTKDNAHREAVFGCPQSLWDAFKAEHGREMTVEDIPIGYWNRIVVMPS